MSLRPPISVLLVEDSPIALKILGEIILAAPSLTLAGTARDGREALGILPQLDPDVVCTDLYMRGIDGLELTRQIMARFPRPILVVSVAQRNSKAAFDLLEAGAIDVLAKPASGLPGDYQRQANALVRKIEVLAGVKVFTKPLRDRTPQGDGASLTGPVGPISAPLASRYRLLVIGASTGGPQATTAILSQLPASFPIPIVCVQHISKGFLEGMVAWLGRECALQVKIAAAGESPQAGTVYYASENRHLEIDARGRLAYSDDPPIEKHRPSISVLFASAAHYFGNGVAGILLTGMGRDGASGLEVISQAGGLTIAQDEATSIVFGMPKEAIALGAAARVLPIESIAPFLLRSVAAGSL